MEYTKNGNMRIVEIAVKNAKIIMTDCAKKTAAEKNYANAGFFGTYHEDGEAFTLPAAHLVCDYAADNDWTRKYCTERGRFNGDKFLFDAGSWTYQNQFYGKSVSTLVIKDGKADVIDLEHMTDGYDYAISGVPIMRGGKDVIFNTYVKGQGWDSSVLYATYHTFLGLKADRTKLYIIGLKTTTNNMIRSAEAYNKFKPLGFEEVIKLDGGGSYIFNVDGEVSATSENRRINTIITFDEETNEEEEEEEKPNEVETIATDIVKIAKAEIGVKESPANSNNVKYNTWYYGKEVSGSAYSWCMTFVQWVFNQAGMPLPHKTASCTSLMNYAKSHGLWVTKNFKAGDIILYQFDSDSYADHTGICESATSSTVTCIEGNTSVSGSQFNGGEVCRKIRNISLVMGAYRPKYKEETGGTCKVEVKQLSSGSKGNSVKSLQLILIGNGYSCGSYGADGDFGSGTLAAVKKFQKAKGLTADGIVGSNTWNALLN